MQIVGKVLDIYKTLANDDTCYSQVEKINEYGVLAADLAEIISYLRGFDNKWDQSVERKHIRRVDFKKQIKAEIAAIPHTWDDIFYGAAPMAYEYVQSIIEMINQFFEQLDHTMTQMVD